MLDGIRAVIPSKHTLDDIALNFDKAYGEEKFYLETNKCYRSEEDVFESFSENERNQYFGKAPSTVWENIVNLHAADHKLDVLMKGNVFTPKLLASYIAGIQNHWTYELENRILMENSELIRNMKKCHQEDITDVDAIHWEAISKMRLDLMKDCLSNKSLFTQIKEAIGQKDYNYVSQLQIEMQEKITNLKESYHHYKNNLID
jgi:glutamine synthetase